MIVAHGVTSESSTAKHTLGQRFFDEATGKEYIYCQASEAMDENAVLSVTGAHAASELDTGNDVVNAYIAVAPLDVTSDYYFWGQIYGSVTILVAGAITATNDLNATATAGQVDDDDSGTNIINMFLVSDTTGAGTGTAFMNYPGIEHG